MKNNNKSAKTNTFKEKEWYKNKIVEMTKQIKDQRFLKAIYISMSDYIKENEPD